MAGIRLDGLRLGFGAQPVIDGLDLAVDDGEFLVLLGPSGCGKSTLLHGIAGLVAPRAGRVWIGGQDMTEADPAERGIGMVFQSYALYPTMTVERNLSFGLRVAGLPRAEVSRRVARAAQLLQLEPLLGRRPAQLSGGQRQRVAIGRALVREAGVCLFDEPLSNLDAQLRADLRRELKLLHRRLGTTMVYVTHDQVEAMTLASRIVVMRQGRIQQVGTPHEVYHRPANLFVAGFLGAPPMNLVPGQLVATAGGQGFSAPGLALDLPGPIDHPGLADASGEAGTAGRATTRAAGQPVVLGVRPEHLTLGDDGPWAGTVQLVEPTGHQQVVWVDAGGHTLAALVAEGAAPAVGQAVRLAPATAQLSLFDQASGQRL